MREIDEEICGVVNRYNAAKRRAELVVRKCLPIGTRVKIGCVTGEIKGYPEPGLIDVLFENGNIWTKPITIIDEIILKGHQ